MKLSEEKLIKIKSKLTKLMALSASPIEAEATLAMEKCRELMLLYDIRTIDVDPIEKTCGVKETTVESMSKSMWERMLAVKIATALDGNAILIPVYANGRKTSDYSICFIAGDTDIDIIVTLYQRLRRNIGAMAVQYSAMGAIDYKAIRNSYCHGVVVSVGKNLDTVYTADIANTYALVVIKKDAVDNKMRALFPNLKEKTVKASVNKNHTRAFLHGYEDGKTVGVHTGVLR